MEEKLYPHEWQNSPYSHGEWACKHCLATNREIAVIGDPNFCPDRKKAEEKRNDDEA